MRIVDRPGTNGYAFDHLGKKGQGITQRTRQWVATLSAANSADDTYRALQGTLVTVIDDMGRTVNNVKVLDVRVLQVQQLLDSIPAGSNYEIIAEWLLQPTQ